MMKASIFGYKFNKKRLFLCVTVTLQKLIAPARRILEGGLAFPNYGTVGDQTYESNIDFEVCNYILLLNLLKNIFQLHF